jgi:hypothetical protein
MFKPIIKIEKSEAVHERLISKGITPLTPRMDCLSPLQSWGSLGLE